jgi:hypothetical protein
MEEQEIQQRFHLYRSRPGPAPSGGTARTVCQVSEWIGHRVMV